VATLSHSDAIQPSKPLSASVLSANVAATCIWIDHPSLRLGGKTRWTMAAITFWANFDGGTLSSLHNKAGKSVKSGKRKGKMSRSRSKEKEDQGQNQAVVADKNDECQKENRKDNIFSAQLNFWPLKM